MGNRVRYVVEVFFLFAVGCVALVAVIAIMKTTWGGGRAVEWFTAIGTVSAVLVAVIGNLWQQSRARLEDEKRRQEPLLSLSTIVFRGERLIMCIPSPSERPSTKYVQRYFEHEADTRALVTVQHALQSFPVERLVDYSAIQCLFDMQDALDSGRSALEFILAGPHQLRPHYWMEQEKQISEAKRQATVAIQNLNRACADAGVRGRVVPAWSRPW